MSHDAEVAVASVDAEKPTRAYRSFRLASFGVGGTVTVIVVGMFLRPMLKLAPEAAAIATEIALGAVGVTCFVVLLVGVARLAALPEALGGRGWLRTSFVLFVLSVVGAVGAGVAAESGALLGLPPSLANVLLACYYLSYVAMATGVQRMARHLQETSGGDDAGSARVVYGLLVAFEVVRATVGESIIPSGGILLLLVVLLLLAFPLAGAVFLTNALRGTRDEYDLATRIETHFE